MDVFESLKKSKFRSSFHLSKKLKEYVYEKGIDKIQSHAYDFINKRLKPKEIINDGKQTPMKGHPVFILGMQLRHVVEVVYINGIK